MANNENNNKEITAGDLFSKLGKDTAKKRNDTQIRLDKISSIDVSESNNQESDSDLDISELLKKYLPEFSEEDTEDEVVNIDVAEPEEEKIEIIEKTEEVENSEENTSIQFADSLFNEYELDKSSPAPEEVHDTVIPEADDVVIEELVPAEIITEETVADNAAETVPETEDDSEVAMTMSFLDSLLGNKQISDVVDEEESADEPVVAEETSGKAEIAEESVETADDEKDEIGLSDGLFTVAKDEDYEDYIDVPAEENNEIDPTDLNLMVAFDLDSDDDETAQKAKEIGDKLQSKADKAAKKFVLDRPEYVDKSQTAEIRKEFKSKKLSLAIRTIACAIFTVLLFIFENLPSITRLISGEAKQFAGVFDPALYPVVFIMVSLQIMLFAALCALPEIMYGLRCLFKGVLRTESLTAVLTILGIIYSVVLCSIIKSPTEPVMLNFCVALSVLLTLIAAILNNKREIMNFRIVSNKKSKHIVRKMDDEEAECETQAFENNEEICDVMKIEKTDFVENFFTRLRTPNQSMSTMVLLVMGAPVAAGIILGIFASLQPGNGIVVTWQAVFATIYMLSPISVFVSFAYPFFRANKAAQEYDSAIIGEASLEEYSNASIISFDDKNVFPSTGVKVQNIRIYNNARIDRVLYYASSVFSYAGGPLQDVFEIATKDMGISNNVQIFDTDSGFLATQVDGVNIIFGDYNALTSRGLEIPTNAAEDDVDLSDELSIMYMFRESVLVAKLYIKYDMDEDIDVILKQFAGDGMFVCVRTFDPNIDEDMISKKLNMKKMPLKIIRNLNPEDAGKFAEKAESGLVSCSTPKSLLQVISYCEKVLHTRRTNNGLAIISMFVSVLLLLLLLLTSSLSIISSLLIGLYQLVWLIPVIISTKMFIR